MARRRRYNHKRRRGSLSFLYKLLAFVLICTAISLALTLFSVYAASRSAAMTAIPARRSSTRRASMRGTICS